MRSGSSTTGPAAASASSSHTAAAVITIDNFTFRVPASVEPGATVQVKNDDSVGHTVTSDQGGQFNVAVSNGGTASFTAPDKPGRYNFRCTIHPYMHGVLVVRR